MEGRNIIPLKGRKEGRKPVLTCGRRRRWGLAVLPLAFGLLLELLLPPHGLVLLPLLLLPEALLLLLVHALSLSFLY